jgi:hypothetical protein
MAMNTKTVILGPEYDQELRSRLGNVLSSLGAIIDDSSWGVGGSQEIMELEATISGTTLHIEAETYIGLSISGAEEIVDRIAALVNQKPISETKA